MNVPSALESKIFVVFILSFGISLSSYSQDATHLNFDGVDDYVVCGAFLTPGYTKEAWIYITNLSPGNNIITGGPETKHALWAPAHFGSRLSAGHNDVWNQVQDDTPLSLNTWYHVAVTYDGATGTMKLYKNGVLVDMNTGIAAYNGTNVVRLGGYGNGDYPFQGSMDEVRIWNYARSDAQISGSMNCELAGNEAGLLAYYKCNQGLAGQPNPAVTTVTDATANGNSGTLTNFALTGSTSNWLDGSPIITGSVIPAAPTASPQSFCIGATVADLSATGAGTISWYTTAVGGAPLSAATMLATGTYYCAAANVAGCESDRTAVNVTITTGTLGLNAKLTWSNTCSPTGTINIIQENLLTTGFTTLPAGATLTGNAVITGGECVLTSNTSNQAGTIIFGDPAFTAAPLEGNFDFFTGGGSGADGFSFNYGVTPPGYVHPLGNEYGVVTSGLVIRFIEYGASQVQLVYNDVVLSTVNFALNTNTYKTCLFNINKNGALTLSIGGTPVFTDITLPGYTTADRTGWQFAFSGRTGGLNNFHKIDNVTIQTPFPTQFSVDGVNWQTSPLFAGLSTGTYVVMGARGGPACPEILDTVTFSVIAAGAVYYVNPNATGANNGTSWADAFTSLDTALSLSCVEIIWVAEGTYLPSLDAFGGSPADPRDKTFYVSGSKHLYGGFAGNETSLSQRDIAVHPTILSGDIGVPGDSTDNCYNVVIVHGTGSITVDGFYVRDGTANSNSTYLLDGSTIFRNWGGGLTISKLNNGFFNIRNNYILHNTAITGGGGIYYEAINSSNIDSISNNVITGNNSPIGNAGGMYVYLDNAGIHVSGNFFSSNTAVYDGAMTFYNRNINSHPKTIINNVFYNNSAEYIGGVAIHRTPVVFSSNTLLNNSASFNGGGVYLNGYSQANPVQVSNNIFRFNKLNGSAAVATADIHKINAPLAVFENNSLQLAAGGYTTSGGNGSDLGLSASGNLFAQDPWFVNENDIAGPDGLFGTADDGLRVYCGSPVVNAGIPMVSVTTDITGFARNPSTPVIGAYEVTEMSAPTPAAGYRSLTVIQDNVTVYSDCSDLVATVQSTGASPVSGSTTATVWVEPTQPAQYVKRHYEITPAANAATATGKIILYFTQAEFDAFNDVNAVDLPTGPADAAGIANLLIEKRSGTSSDNTGLPETYSGSVTTIDPDDASIVWNAINSRWEIAFDVTGFSGFFVKTSSFALPVTIVSFTAEKQLNGAVNIQWKTEDEYSFEQYEIERSSNGAIFESLGIIKARNTTGNNEYNFIDNSIWMNDVRYYRLKSVDKDGKYKYSTIVRLVKEQKGGVSIYPNPAGKMVTVRVMDARLLHTRVIIVDAGGRTINWFNISNTDTKVNTGHLARGVYYLRVADGSSIKLIKE